MKMSHKIACAGVVAATAGFALRSLIQRSRRYCFANRVVVVTGGSRGLGLVLARQLVQQRARVAICARDAEELARAETELRQLGGDVFTKVCDVNRPEAVYEFIADVRSVLGPVDVLINNAGVISVGPIETMTQRDYEQAMATHFWGPYHMIEAVLPDMRERGQGRIVNIASIGGKIGVPHLVPYCASKFALVGLSQALRPELLKDGIYVTTICPGLMRTGSPRNAWFKGQHRLEYAWFSISDSLPLVAINSERAAAQILNACRDGRAEFIVSLPAKLATTAHLLATELSCDLLSLVHRLLPGPGGIGQRAVKGSQSQSAISPSWLTTLNERAAVRNNEYAAAKNRHARSMAE